MTENEKAFAAIVDSMSYFFTCSNVKGVRKVDSFPDDLDTNIRRSVVERKRSSWFDDRLGMAVVYGPAVNGYDRAFWQSQVLRVGIERFGLGGLFREGSVSDMVLRGLNRRLGTDFGSLDDIEARMMQMLRDRTMDPNLWRDASLAVCRPFGLEENKGAMSWALVSGLKGRGWLSAREAVSRGDYSLFDESAAAGLESVLSGDGGIRGTVLSFGPAGEAYRRVGYPASELRCHADHLVCCLKEMGIDPVSFGTEGLASLVQDPLMIVRSLRERPDGTRPFVAVLDRKIDVPGYGREYVAMSIHAPENFVSKAMRLRDEGKDAYLLMTPVFLSEKAVQAILRDEANWKYLRPSGGPDTAVFDYVERLKKGGATASPVYENSGSTQRSLTVAKIAENFRNPMSSAKYLMLYGYERDPLRDASERRAALEAESARLDREAVLESGVMPKVGKLDEPFPVSLVDGPARQRLFDGGIRNAGDVIREGFDRVRELAGTDRAVNRIAAWLAGRDIYVYPKEESVVSGERPTEETVRAHFFDTVLKAGASAGGSLVFPMGLSGDVFTGADAVHLMAAGLTMKTRGCPVWATGGQLEALGCRTGRAEPVPVMVGDRPEYVYNLSGTEFPKRYPDEYAAFISRAKEDCGENRDAGRYFSIILGSMGVAARQNVEGLMAWMDRSDSPAFGALRSAHGASLESVIGQQGMREMLRRGKTLRMYEAVKDANVRVKSKGQKPK